MGDKYLDRLKVLKTKTRFKGKYEAFRDAIEEPIGQQGVKLYEENPSGGYTRIRRRGQYTDEEKKRFAPENIYAMAEKILKAANSIKDDDSRLEEINRIYDSEEILGIAHNLLRLDNPDYVLAGAKLYELLGKADKPFVKNKLLETIEQHPDKKIDLGDVEKFLRRNSTGGKKEGHHGLEGKFTTMIIAGIGIISGFLMLSPTVTGNVVGGMSTVKSSALGVGLIVISILGYYFISKFLDN